MKTLILFVKQYWIALLVLALMMVFFRDIAIPVLIFLIPLSLVNQVEKLSKNRLVRYFLTSFLVFLILGTIFAIFINIQHNGFSLSGHHGASNYGSIDHEE